MSKFVKPFVGEVLFSDGTRKDIVLAPSVFRFAAAFASQIPGLLEGTGLNEIVSELPNIVSVSRTDHESLHVIDSAYKRDGSARRQAAFRLGQMDMREAVCDLLRDEAKKIPRPDGFRIYELIDKIEQLEVLHADT